MPEHLRALVVILGLATIVFAFAKAPACAIAMAPKDFNRRCILWFAITLTAFLAHNFWIFIIVTAVLLLFTLPREPNKLAMFFFVLFAVPPISGQITGLGIIEHFFTINVLRLLALVVLLPAFLSLRRQADVEPFGRMLPDKLIAGYLILNFLLQLSVDTFTNTMRAGVFYAFIDIFLPYYVTSRSLKSLQAFREVLMAFVIAALVLSAIGAFEFAKHWLLYSAMVGALDVPWAGVGYLPRGENLRALGTAGHSIALGYVIAVAIGFFLYLRRSAPNPMAWGLGLILLIAGLIASLSRGPWVGTAAILLLFVATGSSPGLRFAKFGLLGTIIISALLASPAGETIVAHLPFVGAIDEGSVPYRQRLLEISIQVIMQNPFFGSFDFYYAPVMQELRQGQGIIDIVNSYVGVALAHGLVGLSLYSGFFIAVALSILKGMRNLPNRIDERYLLGQALLSTLLGILIIIFTVSSITIIPVVYWSVAGLGVAYARMLALARAPKAAKPAGLRQASMEGIDLLKPRGR
jgi:O-antigen ligase